MGVKKIKSQYLIADVPEDRNNRWDDGIQCYVKSADKLYILDNGVWTEFGGTTGGVSWGAITGILASQTDLNTALSGKVADNDSRLSDARNPLTHAHSASDVTGTAVITNDSRLSDARTPVAHNQDWSTINSGRPTTLSGYGITDGGVTKQNVEAVLTGEISTHTHPGGGGGLSQPQVMARSLGC